MVADDNSNTTPPASPAEEPWERARRERLAQLDAEQAHGERLLQRYGRGSTRPAFAAVGHVSVKRRRR